VNDSLQKRVAALYSRYEKPADKATVDWFLAAIADLTPAEIDSAFREGPKIWKYMPRPAEFRDAVRVTAAEATCGKCANGFVADPEAGPNCVKRCECRKKKGADSHEKGKP
jgi:hypothetical protein